MLIHELVATIKVYNFIGHLCICIEAACEILHHFMCDRGHNESFDMLRMNKEFYHEIIVFSEQAVDNALFTEKTADGVDSIAEVWIFQLVVGEDVLPVETDS